MSIHARYADVLGSDDHIIVLVTESPERWASAVRQWRASGMDVVVTHCPIVAAVMARAWHGTFNGTAGFIIVCQSAAEAAHNNWGPGDGDVPEGWIAVGYRWAGADWSARPTECLRLLDGAKVLHHISHAEPPAFLLGMFIGWVEGRQEVAQ